jgi:hypothetical protein
MQKTLKPWWRHGSLLLPAVTLLAALSVQGAHYFREVPQARGPHLADAIPSALPGWVGRDVPLGPNEFVAGEVEKVLNYDEVINREFSRPGANLGIYVAYWGAGKMPTRLVASHTPDRCWTENGWRCVEMKFKQSRTFEGASLQPAEWRIFEPPVGGQLTYVMYWHLVEDRIYDYGERFNQIPDPFLWWKDAMDQIWFGSREQHFIRITSNQPLENLWSDPGFTELLRGLERLGLGLPTARLAQGEKT